VRTQPDYPLVTAAIEIFADWWKHWNRKYDLEALVDPASNPARVAPATPTAARVTASAGR